MNITKIFIKTSIVGLLLGVGQIAFGQKVSYGDTAVLKKLKWNRLNEFVNYYIVRPGKQIEDPKQLVFKVKPIATYQYYKKGFEAIKNDTSVKARSTDITQLLLSNKFSHLRGLEAIFKINSKVAFVQEPGRIFRKISIRAKTDDKKSLDQLMNKLGKETFVGGLKIDTSNSFKGLVMHGVNKAYITIVLKPQYMDANKVTTIRKQLKKWNDIEDVISSMDLFQGYSEQELYYHINSL